MLDTVTPPGLLQESLGPFGPKRLPRVSKKCPKSVPRVSKRCPGHSGDTLGHFLDTPVSVGREGPRRHPEGHSRDTSGPKSPRDSCSKSGALQIECSTPLSRNTSCASILPWVSEPIALYLPKQAFDSAVLSFSFSTLCKRGYAKEGMSLFCLFSVSFC